MSDGNQRWGSVSHHYSHLGVATADGVTVAGVGNLYAVGDAAGTGHWCGHHVRFPGVALANCLVTAKLAAQHVTRTGPGMRDVRRTAPDLDGDRPIDRRLLLRQEKRLRTLNTEAVLNYEFGSDQAGAAGRWLDRLTDLSKRSVIITNDLYELSVLTALACSRVAVEGVNEPVHLTQEEVAKVLHPASGR